MPTKFKFRLEQVLNYKKHYEDKLRQELKELLVKLEEQKEHLLRLKEEENRIYLNLRKKQEGKINIFETLIFYLYLYKIHQDIDNQKKMIDDITIEIEKKRNEVIEASKERKILEKLKEKKFLEYQMWLGREEQKFLDGIANNAFARSNSAILKRG